MRSSPHQGMHGGLGIQCRLLAVLGQLPQPVRVAVCQGGCFRISRAIRPLSPSPYRTAPTTRHARAAQSDRFWCIIYTHPNSWKSITYSRSSNGLGSVGLVRTAHVHWGVSSSNTATARSQDLNGGSSTSDTADMLAARAQVGVRTGCMAAVNNQSMFTEM